MFQLVEQSWLISLNNMFYFLNLFNLLFLLKNVTPHCGVLSLPEASTVHPAIWSIQLSVCLGGWAAVFLWRPVFCNYKDPVCGTLQICFQKGVGGQSEGILDLWPLTFVQLPFFLGQLATLRGPAFNEWYFIWMIMFHSWYIIHYL